MASTFTPSLSFRSHGSQRIRTTPVASPAGALTSQSSAILLIHGYNNSEQGAAESFAAFSGHLALGANLIGVQWPGDNWSGALYYMGSVEQAMHTAAALAEALASAARGMGLLRVCIVAHSLGCRVTMETMRRLEATRVPGLVIEKVVLMAAAVPTFMLDKPSDQLGRAIRTPGARFLSIFSPDDRVLQFAFPIGQSLAPGRNGFFPTALGRRRWHTGTMLTDVRQRHAVGAGHSDYWGKKPESLHVARPVIKVAREFLTTGRLISVEEKILPERAASTVRRIPARSTGVRRML